MALYHMLVLLRAPVSLSSMYAINKDIKTCGYVTSAKHFWQSPTWKKRGRNVAHVFDSSCGTFQTYKENNTMSKLFRFLKAVGWSIVGNVRHRKRKHMCDSCVNDT